MASWWNAGLADMPIYKIGDALYCCDGWNGEAYTEAFRVLDHFMIDKTHPGSVTLRPIYRFEDEEREFDEDDETASEIVGFSVI